MRVIHAGITAPALYFGTKPAIVADGLFFGLEFRNDRREGGAHEKVPYGSIQYKTIWHNWEARVAGVFRPSLIFCLTRRIRTQRPLTLSLARIFGCNNKKGYRSEEHTSELQSLMRISYAVFCLKKKKKKL